MALEAEELELPDFLNNSSEEEIHEKMLSNLPEDIDKSEGGFPFRSLPAAGNLPEHISGQIQ